MHCHSDDIHMLCVVGSENVYMLGVVIVRLIIMCLEQFIYYEVGAQLN